MPTLLDASGSQPPSNVHGVSLLPWINGAEKSELPVYTELVILRTDRIKRMLAEDGWKILETNRYSKPHRFAATYELYNIRTDPGEAHNLAKEQNVMLGYMRMRLLRFAQERVPQSGVQSRQVEIDPEMQERLRALGYVDE